MSDISLLAAVLLREQLNQASAKQPVQQVHPNTPFDQVSARSLQFVARTLPNVRPELHSATTEFALPAQTAPGSGSQFYRQRLMALKSGRLYTRLPMNSFQQFWAGAAEKPTHQQWRRLLALEAKAVARGQGNRRLSVMVGDSLSMWYPSDRLPSNQLWLNQSISGETTRDILQRLADFSQVRPSTIYVMAGVNDLKQGVTDNEILWNLRQIVRRLRQMHPHSRIVVQSILPTRSTMVSSSRIAQLNQRLSAIVQQNGVSYLDLHPYLADTDGEIQRDLTTDGIHLSSNGYEAWQLALLRSEILTAQGG